MITHDKDLPNLPGDIIHEILSLLDTEALKACSLTGKALSCLAKPFIHRTLHFTPPSEAPTGSNVSDRRNESNGLQVLGERGLLQHTRHISIFHPTTPLLEYDLQPHIQHLHTLTNLRSLSVRRLDMVSFLSKMEEYFGALLGTLHSLKLESPKGDHIQIFQFVCHFRNLRDLKINGIHILTSSNYNTDRRLDIKASPPLDGTLDLHLSVGPRLERRSMGAQLIFSTLAMFPSGLKFRTLKLSGCVSSNLQLLIDACAPTLEYMELKTQWVVGPNYPHLDFKRHLALRKLEIGPLVRGTVESPATWLSETLSTIPSKVLTKLTVSVFITSSDAANKWHFVDNVLDHFSLCDDVTLVASPPHWTVKDEFKELAERLFPLMRKNGRMVVKMLPHLGSSR